jgi:hypothetical protein
MSFVFATFIGEKMLGRSRHSCNVVR